MVQRYAKQWQLPAEFSQWLKEHNTFCSTLVDRIVTGYPHDTAEALQQELGYKDSFLDTAEYFYLFVIQGPKWLAQELHLDALNLNVHIVDNIKPYKERKVAILNGAHTVLLPVAFLSDLNTVGDAMKDKQISMFVEKTIAEEILTALDLPHEELMSFAKAVLSRFRNPFIQHQLISIALNSMTKFRTRVLPQLLTFYQKKGVLPARLVFSLAALLVFYRGERSTGNYPLREDTKWLTRYALLWQGIDSGEVSLKQLATEVLGDAEHWGQDLTQVPGLVRQVEQQLRAVLDQGVRQAISAYC
jgi:tagaturonate reductase